MHADAAFGAVLKKPRGQSEKLSDSVHSAYRFQRLRGGEEKGTFLKQDTRIRTKL